MPTQHPINANLTDGDLDTLCDSLTNITLAYEGFHLDGLAEFCERVLPLDRFNELRAYFGAIRECHETVCTILYGTPDSRLDEIAASKQRHPAGRVRIMTDDDVATEMGNAMADTIEGVTAVVAEMHVEADQANPHGMPWYKYNAAVDRLTKQFQRGLLTRQEYDAAVATLNAEGVQR